MQNKPQRRIFIFVKSIDGGTGTFVLSLQKIPNYIKNEVLVKTFVVENPIYRTVKNESFVYCRSNSSSSPSKYAFSMDNILAFFGNLVWYIRKVKDYDPDVIISVDIYCNIIVLIAKFSLFLRNNVIITTHNNLFDTLHLKGDSTVEWSVSKLVRLLYARADYLVVVSKGIRKSFQRKFKLRKNIRVIYYGLDQTHLTTRIGRKKQSENIILSIGRLDVQKDFLTLIRSFHLLNQKFGKTMLWIVGDGPQKGEIEQLISELKLNKKIKILGWRQNIYPFLKKAKVFVLSTNREGFGYVIIEAMSQGIPIIATNVNYGPAEILDNGKYGILVDKNDPLSLSRSMLKLMTNKRYYDSFKEKAKERSKFFSEEKMLRSYAVLINKLLFK